jgi:hypothetical protein
MTKPQEETMPLPIGTDRRHEYERGITFDAFLATVDANRELWHALTSRASVVEEVVARAGRIRGRWHLLVILEDWCGDAVNIVPVLARLVEQVPSIELRILRRDENLSLTDEHLTTGKRAIPIVIVLDEDLHEVECWGPRPRELKHWHRKEGMSMDKADRYRSMRRWYAQDRGRSTLDEILAVLCAASSEPELCSAA